MENQPSEAGRDPRSVPGSAPASRSRGPLIIAVITVAGVAVAVGTYFGVKSSTDDAIAGLLTETSAPEVPGHDPATVDADTFENTLSRVQQMDYAGPKLNASMDADRESIITQLDDMGWADYNYFNREVVEPSINNTPQEIWDQITLGQFKIWKIAQEGDVEEAKKLATGVVEGQEYDEFTAILGNGGAPVVPVGAAEAIYPAKSSGDYAGVDANGLDVIEFKKTTVYDGDQVKVVARLTKGNDDNSLRWVLVKTLSV